MLVLDLLDWSGPNADQISDDVSNAQAPKDELAKQNTSSKVPYY